MLSLKPPRCPPQVSDQLCLDTGPAPSFPKALEPSGTSDPRARIRCSLRPSCSSDVCDPYSMASFVAPSLASGQCSGLGNEGQPQMPLISELFQVEVADHASKHVADMPNHSHSFNLGGVPASFLKLRWRGQMPSLCNRRVLVMGLSYDKCHADRHLSCIPSSAFSRMFQHVPE